MISPELVAQITDLGGLGLFILLVIVAAVGLWRKWWVPGWMYVKVEDENATLIRTVERLTDQLARERGRSQRLAGDLRRLGSHRRTDASP